MPVGFGLVQPSAPAYGGAQPYDWGAGAARIMHSLSAWQQQRHDEKRARELEAAQREQAAEFGFGMQQADGDSATLRDLGERAMAQGRRALADDYFGAAADAAGREEKEREEAFRLRQQEALEAHRTRVQDWAERPIEPEEKPPRFDDLVNPETGQIQPAMLDPMTGEFLGWVDYATGYPPVSQPARPQQFVASMQDVESARESPLRFLSRPPGEQQTIRAYMRQLGIDPSFVNPPTEQAQDLVDAWIEGNANMEVMPAEAKEMYRRIWPDLGPAYQDYARRTLGPPPEEALTDDEWEALRQRIAGGDR